MLGYNYPSHKQVINLTDEALERIRVSIPQMFISKNKGKTLRQLRKEYQKEDERMKAAGYRKEYTGGFSVWKKGMI